MPKDITTDMRIGVIPGESVALPSHDFIANAQMTREGADLRLTLPDGHSVVVTGYFEQNTPPDLVAADGARLSPHLVDSFLLPTHPGEYAAAGGSANDASPSGKVTAVAGEAHIIRADGTHIPAAVGTQVFQGDVIETAKTGAVNIIFADNTAFAVSESARMSVDKFIYDAEQHSGTSFFAMLQGAFVYTSGLIGKSDPGNVNIETPVGTIGIRGTADVGEITPDGHGMVSGWDGSSYVHTHSGIDVSMIRRFEGFSFEPGRAPVHLETDPRQFIAAHKTLFDVVDQLWLEPLINIYQQQHHDVPHQLHLQVPHANEHGMLMDQGDDTQTAAWGFRNPEQLIDGIYNLFPGGAVQALTPLAIPAGAGVPPVPLVGTNTNDIFYINNSNTEPGVLTEFVVGDYVQVDLGNGYDRLWVKDILGEHIDFDQTIAHSWTFSNVEELILGTTARVDFANHFLGNLRGVFDMTDADHILKVEAHANDGLTSFADIEYSPGVTGEFSAKVVTAETTTYTGTALTGEIVTLVISNAGMTIADI
ncbi:MAG: FecR domain-containing protein [Alphaproteobacteria bacterium]|nr:FecR domain-containing protein [Alphaproteobacteria bacterium]